MGTDDRAGRRVIATESQTITCACGTTTQTRLPAVLRGGWADDPPVLFSVTCSSCGRWQALDHPVLIVFDEGLVGAVFVPAEATRVDVDGVDGARLIKLAEVTTGRSPVDEECSLTSAPARLAELVSTRRVDVDAVTPSKVQVAVDEDTLADYREWLGAIRDHVGVTAAVDATVEVLSATRWSGALSACQQTPVIGTDTAAAVVERVLEAGLAGADAELSRAAGPRAAFLRRWRERGGDPANVLLGPDEEHSVPITLAARAALDGWFSSREAEPKVRVAHLEQALRAVEASPGGDESARIAVRAGLSAELYGRRVGDDIARGQELLAEAIALAEDRYGRQALETLRLRVDRAVLLLDDPRGRSAEGRSELIDVQQVAATALAEDDSFQAVAAINVGTAWLEARDLTERGPAQEEGISWLEQALDMPGLSDESEVLACANLSAALRARLIRRSDDGQRADALTERAVVSARRLHQPGEPLRLVGSLATAANAATSVGRHEQAVALSREALAIAATSMAGQHPDVLRARANGASILHNRASATRMSDPAQCDMDLREAAAEMAVTADLMDGTAHPMAAMVRANHAAVLADHDSAGRVLDAAAARDAFTRLIDSLDPVIDAEVLTTLGLNAGTFFLGQGDPLRARECLRAGLDGANALADRELLIGAQQTAQTMVSRLGRRLAVALSDGVEPKFDEAFDVLDAGRARLVGATTALVRAATVDDTNTTPAVASARDVLRRQLGDERSIDASPDPGVRRVRARELHARVGQAIESIAGVAATSPPSAEIPLVHVSAETLAIVVAIRFPDGTTSGFATTVIAERHLTAMAAGDAEETRLALDEVLTRLGEHVGEPLARELLGRGHRHAVMIPGGPCAAVPWNAVPLRRSDETSLGHLNDVLELRLAPAARLLESHRPTTAPRRPAVASDPSLAAGRWESERLKGMTAKDDAVLEGVYPWPPDTDWLHLSAHGREDPADPLRSHIDLPAGPIRIDELLTSHSLPFGSTVVATACRAARVLAPNYDESLSVAHALVAAGAETVIAGLWDVPDLATAIIVSRMYAHLETDALWAHPETALRSAQRWVRDADRATLSEEAAQARTGETWLPAPLAAQLALRLRLDGSKRPFAHPFDWAGLAVLSTRPEQ
jgi:CHAT domain